MHALNCFIFCALTRGLNAHFDDTNTRATARTTTAARAHTPSNALHSQMHFSFIYFVFVSVEFYEWATHRNCFGPCINIIIVYCSFVSNLLWPSSSLWMPGHGCVGVWNSHKYPVNWTLLGGAALITKLLKLLFLYNMDGFIFVRSVYLLFVVRARARSQYFQFYFSFCHSITLLHFYWMCRRVRGVSSWFGGEAAALVAAGGSCVLLRSEHV